MPDVLEALRELRQSSVGSVVSGFSDGPPRPHFDDGIGEFLCDLVRDRVTSSDSSGISLVVLCGNAGDGKSALLLSAWQQLEREGLKPSDAMWLLDATQSDEPHQTSRQRLEEFFQPFDDGKQWAPPALHLIAINTGRCINFFQQETSGFKDLFAILRRQLAIDDTPIESTLQQKYEQVLVIDLERRAALDPEYGRSAHPNVAKDLWEHMLDTLDPDKPSFPRLKDALSACKSCSSAGLCPVYANLASLRYPRVRARLRQLLVDVTFNDRVHIGARGLWDLLYQLTIGGLDRHQTDRDLPVATCADVPELTEEQRSATLFYNALFPGQGVAERDWTNAILREIQGLDPSRVFSLQRQIGSLSGALSDEEHRLLVHSVAAELGLSHEVFTKITYPQAKIIQRWMWFFLPEKAKSAREQWLDDWIGLVLAHKQELLAQIPASQEETEQIAGMLKSVIQQIFGAGPNRTYFELALPWKSDSAAFAHASIKAKPDTTTDPRVLNPRPDQAQGMRRTLEVELSRALRSHPLALSVTLTVSGLSKSIPGNRVRMQVKWPLYQLLRQVADLSYLTASLDPERFSQVEQVHRSLAALAATGRRMAVQSKESNNPTLVAFELDDDGTIEIEESSL